MYTQLEKDLIEVYEVDTNQDDQYRLLKKVSRKIGNSGRPIFWDNCKSLEKLNESLDLFVRCNFIQI